MKVSFYRYMLAAFAAASLTAAGSALAQVDVAKSSVTATSKQMNVPVEGKFGKFTAQVKFDPAKPADGSCAVQHRRGQLRSRRRKLQRPGARQGLVRREDYPTATFVSSAIAPAGGNQFKVTGKLTIKGKSQTVVVPVTVTQQGAKQTFDGSLPIKRSQFDIGTGEWKDTSVVADDVVIKFHIVAAHK